MYNRLKFDNCLSSVYNCDDQLHVHAFLCRYMIFHIFFACVDVLRLVGDEKRVGGIKKEMPIIKPANAFEGGIH